MIIRIDENDFIREFEAYGRGNQFTDEALRTIFNLIEESEGENTELDVIGICCSFTEYEDLDDYNGQNGTEHEDMSEIENEYCIFYVGGYNDGFLVME